MEKSRKTNLEASQNSLRAENSKHLDTVKDSNENLNENKENDEDKDSIDQELAEDEKETSRTSDDVPNMFANKAEETGEQRKLDMPVSADEEVSEQNKVESTIEQDKEAEVIIYSIFELLWYSYIPGVFKKHEISTENAQSTKEKS